MPGAAGARQLSCRCHPASCQGVKGEQGRTSPGQNLQRRASAWTIVLLHAGTRDTCLTHSQLTGARPPSALSEMLVEGAVIESRTTVHPS